MPLKKVKSFREPRTKYQCLTCDIFCECSIPKVCSFIPKRCLGGFHLVGKPEWIVKERQGK